ncbi:MAG: hypothetical protein ABWZ99_15070 [Ilumatobacteraceae bacterium]
MSNLETGFGRAVDSDLEPIGEPVVPAPPIDLDLIERDLRDVETTLARLADGTYFADQPVASVPGTNATASAPSPGAATPGVEH